MEGGASKAMYTLLSCPSGMPTHPYMVRAPTIGKYICLSRTSPIDSQKLTTFRHLLPIVSLSNAPVLPFCYRPMTSSYVPLMGELYGYFGIAILGPKGPCYNAVIQLRHLWA